MRSFFLGLSISVAFVAGCVASQFIVPPARAGTNPMRWEYACPIDTSPAWNDSSIALANRMGAEGWELVTAASKALCFKRPLP